MDFTKLPGKKIKRYGELTNSNKPTISIVTPYYNASKTIEETFNCVINQTYPFFEWIIVNDGSKDLESNRVIEELAKKDSRIKYYKKENGGPSVARDYGIEKTSNDTKYVFFLDADDQMDKTMLECLYFALETHQDASFAYTTMVNFGDKEFIWEKYLTVEQEKEENLICIASLVRKKDLLEVGCFGIKEKAMYEDWNLWLKLIRAGKKPLRVNAPLFWYRYSSNGEFSRANKNRKNAMRYVNETASKIANDILEPIQFPRYGEHYATCKDYNLVLPDYKKSKEKTILYIFPWMVVGGADFFNLELIKRLPKDKYNAIVLTTTPNNNPIRQAFEEYADVYDMSSFLDRIDYLTFTDYIISSRKVDAVVVSNTEYGYYMIPFLKSKYSHIPFIDYIHSIDYMDERKSFGRCTKDVDKYLYKTYCCNNFTKHQLEKDFNKKNVETIYIGTDDKKFNPLNYDSLKLKEKYNLPKDKKIITFLARLSLEKRPTMFIKIAKKIHEKNPNTFFVIAGDGPLMSKVKNKVDENFRLLGMTDASDEVYALSDITINCSSLEGLALTSYESLAMSVPVISTDVGGQKELIDETVGGIVHYIPSMKDEDYQKEIDLYVKETLRVLENLDSISKNCRKKILDSFTLDIMMSKFDKIFEESIRNERDKKLLPIDKTTYELACEVFNTLYFNYTNDYYEKNLGVYLTAKKTKHQRLYRHIRVRLENLGALKEGKNIIEYLRSLKRLLKEFTYNVKTFFIALYSFIIIVLKVIKRVISKPFRK
ncbi:MAG: glycosyltransferase [Bacilli bacterium]|nr:glycosyltransferase [Bacilli bacterium]